MVGTIELRSCFYVFALMLALFVAGFSAVAEACQVTALSSRHNTPINVNRPNNRLFNEVVLHYTNIERCRRGKAPFRSDAKLAGMASGHSKGMGQTGVFSHRVPKRGYETMRDRLDKARVRWRTVAENIAKNYVYAINRRPIMAKVNGPCQFRYTNGQPVPKHTYASLGKAAVAQWMGSSGHRKNILNGRFNRMGAGMFVNPRTSTCGDVFLTQNFAD